MTLGIIMDETPNGSLLINSFKCVSLDTPRVVSRPRVSYGHEKLKSTKKEGDEGGTNQT